MTSSPGEAAKLHLSRSWSASARASRIAFQGLANGCIGLGLQMFFRVFFLTLIPKQFMILMAAILLGVFRPSVEWHEGVYQTSMLKIANNSIYHRRMRSFALVLHQVCQSVVPSFSCGLDMDVDSVKLVYGTLQNGLKVERNKSSLYLSFGGCFALTTFLSGVFLLVL